jgi:hypothetical protein
MKWLSMTISRKVIATAFHQTSNSSSTICWRLIALLKPLRAGEIEAVNSHGRGFAGWRGQLKNPKSIIETNVIGGLSLLDAMRNAGRQASGVSHRQQRSTASRKSRPIEETDPTNPTNPYGATKLGFEQALRWYEQALWHSFRVSTLLQRGRVRRSIVASGTIRRRT